MKKKVGLFLFLALVLALVAIASPALGRAGGATVPFKVECTTYPEVDDSGFPILIVTIPADCIGTHLGISDWYGDTLVDLTVYPALQTGTMEFTAANGAQLFGNIDGEAIPNDIGGFDYWGDYWITSGTGRFEGYTGSGIYYGGAGGGVGTLTFEGTLTRP